MVISVAIFLNRRILFSSVLKLGLLCKRGFVVLSFIFSSLTSVFSGFESPAEKKKFSILALLFGLTIGVYWLFRPLKDSIFLTIVGSAYQPWAKMLSTVVMGCIVVGYSKLIDLYPRHKILYGLSTFYALASIVFAFFIFDPVAGIANTVENPHRYLGWTFYLFVESFGSLMIALFWSFVADTTTPESAKRGYPLIALGAQSGGVIFPLAGKYIMRSGSSGSGVLLCIVGICLIPLVVYYFMHNVPKGQLKGFAAENDAENHKKPKASFWEGIKLLIQSPYILGIFVMVSLYEIVFMFIDFQFKCLARSFYAGDALTDYLTNYAILTNVFAVLCVVFGARKIAQKLGLTKTLLLLPVVVGASAVILSFNQILIIAFIIMVQCKSVNYALHQPAKEQLYIPTTKDSKYKAKAWIDMFGIRFSKGLGSYLNTFKSVLGAAEFTAIALSFSIGLIAIWIYIAMFLGKTHAKAVKENRVIC
jgi:ATP:ADP antiporter, AAA family